MISEWPKESWIRWGPDPFIRGNFLGKGHPLLSTGTFCRELCRNFWTDRFAVWVVDSGGPKEAQVQSYSPRWRQCAHTGRHIGATLQISLNRRSAAAMRSYVKLLWPLVIIWLEARLQLNTGNILQPVLMVFTCSGITPPKVNRFGWNLEHSQYIAWCWAGQILG